MHKHQRRASIKNRHDPYMDASNPNPITKPACIDREFEHFFSRSCSSNTYDSIDQNETISCCRSISKLCLHRASEPNQIEVISANR